MLFLTHRLPYAPNRGDRVRAHFLLQALNRFADVDVVSLVHDEEETAATGHMAGFTSSVRTAGVANIRNRLNSVLALPTSRPLTHTLLDAPSLNAQVDAAVAAHQPDVVLAYCSGMARLALEPPLARLPFVLDMVDVDSAKWEALGHVSRPPMAWIYRREARVLRRFEARAAAAAFASMVVTDRERRTLESIAPGARVDVVSNGVDIEKLRPEAPPSASENVVFCGVMNYPPNEHAARLLALEVWPLVRRRRPEATLTLLGSAPSRAVLALADSASGIVVTGAVPDVRPYLWSAAVAAAPVMTARGIQNKVLEAVAAGLPTVITTNILDSLPSSIIPACVAADGPAAIADAICNLLTQSPEARRAMASQTDVAALSWEQQLAPVESLLRAAVAGSAGRDQNRCADRLTASRG